MSQLDGLHIVPLRGLPEVEQHHDLGVLLRAALDRAHLTLRDGDVLVVSGKLISKAWGLRVHGVERDDLVRSQSRRIVAERRIPTGSTRVVESVAGPVLAAAGIDASNTGPAGGVLLLPEDPDLAARALYAGLLTAFAPAPLPQIGLVVSDTAGRPWRQGQSDFALGACGVRVLEDLRGSHDADGRQLSVTARALADEIAAAADLVKGKSGGVPAALVRGLPEGVVGDPGLPGAAHLVRTGDDDWFAHGASEAVRAALGVPPGSAAADLVGVADVLPETREVKVSRAIALARWEATGTTPPAAAPASAATRVQLSGDAVEVSCADPYQRGRLCARLEVALHSEGLTGLSVHPVDPAAAAVGVSSTQG